METEMQTDSGMDRRKKRGDVDIRFKLHPYPFKPHVFV